MDCSTDPAVGEIWQMALTVDDPQGAGTVGSATVSVRNEGGGELASYAFDCEGGACTGSFRADYDGVTCALAGAVSFVFQVADADGHLSTTTTYTP